MEEWRKIKGYDRYEVSNYGRVRNKEKLIMKQHYKKRGDAVITLSKNGKKKTFRVARLVAKAFLEEDKTRNEVNHIDGNPRNNHVSNLEWVTSSENTIHAYKLGLMPKQSPVALYCVSENRLYTFKTQREACRFLGRSKNFINERIKREDYIYDNYIIIDNNIKGDISSGFSEENYYRW